jgi:GNAT superfamily N-acetyltransferase
MDSAAILARLPDVPRWISARGMLLSGLGSPVGKVTLEPLSFVARRSDTGLVQVRGKPLAADVRAAAESGGDVLAAPEDLAATRAALCGWSAEPATLHALRGEGGALPEPVDCRMLARDDLPRLRRLSAELAEELQRAMDAGLPVGAALSEGAPVAACYATAVTETLWDVSVDTLETHRRRGFASRAAAFMIRFYSRAGKRPVWGSAASNPPSARLAGRLGFAAADTIWLLTPP